MPDSILSPASRRSIFELRRTGTRLADSQFRLATGRKVNSAIDNPASFFTASALRNRAGSLNRVIDNIGLRLQTVRAAEGALDAVRSLVRSAQSVLSAARSAPAPRPTATGDVNVAGVASVTDLAGVSSGDRFSVQVGDASAVTITIAGADSPEALLDALNAIDNVAASFTDEGFLRISATNGEDLALADVTNAPLTGLGLAEGAFDPSSGFSTARAAAAESFDVLRTQIDQLIGDATFNGVNLAAGDALSILFNETGSSLLKIDGVNAGADGLGISQARNNLQLDGDIDAAQAELTGALDSLKEYSSRLSSNVALSQVRREFGNSLSNILEAGADDLTRTDLNEESAMLLSLHTRRRLASTALSLLQRSENDALRLFD